MDYVIAIPSYNRAASISKKALLFLKDGGVSPDKVHIFVANEEQAEAYKLIAPEYKIIVGELGITNQRNHIANYFPEGQYVVSIDDDVSSLHTIEKGKYKRIEDLDAFFKRAFQDLMWEGLFIWGVYPVKSLRFMYDTISSDLKFLPGFLFGYINRKLSSLRMSVKAEGKEDIEQSLLYYLQDGGVLRYNYVTPNQASAPKEGGLGKDRVEMNENAATYLEETYPTLVKKYYRKNGMAELRFARKARRKISSNIIWDF